MFRFWKWKKRKLEVETRLIEEEINRSKRFGFYFCVMVLEVSNSVPFGLSKLLPGKTISYHVLQKYLRSYDRIIGPWQRRYYIILSQTDRSGASAVKERIHDLAQHHNWGDVCIGTAVYPEDGKRPSDLLDKAVIRRS